ncbi:Endonuclease/exonuclease/phosphatase [Pyronema domesticum]|uniref:Similar to Probable inositol polyphosphate 5-phosphatase C9G1.10c acc. no. O14306 n=1 Tax=Pyronema omphalodes (strain CBS 100304) TaxID=1076935 RepID=U4KW57_PYROM|nr:Endonuclease/exonuclease/phosphatase [Pyronema domesticum]CCX05306.1 Similar to Probable inositol polyphosphate 5-phosphatase C9G1.10c; acc. no. O14306 [Pyronema omphalodes CBS 100304]
MADEQPPASVSSLRSRFEQLATSNPPATPTNTEPPANALSPTDSVSSDPFREPHGASVTDDESASSWGVLSPPRNDSYRSRTLPRAYGQSPRQRPHSVYSTFSPPRSPPSLRVDCPRSPPIPPLDLSERTLAPPAPPVPPPPPAPLVPTATGNGYISAVPGAPGRPISPAPKYRSGRTPPPPPPPLSPRHTRPKSTSYMLDEVTGGYRAMGVDPTRTQQDYNTPLLIPAHTGPVQRSGDPDRRAPPPPVPARNAKPRISSRPPALTPRPETTTNGLTPIAPGGERVSPFSTPPSSSGGSPQRSDNEAHPAQYVAPQAAPPATPPVIPPPRPSLPANIPRRTPSQPHAVFSPPPPPPRSETFRNEYVPSKPRNPAPPPPPRMSMDQVRPRINPDYSIKNQRMSLDDTGSRPILPPRPMGLIGGVRARVSRGRSNSPQRPEEETGSKSTFLPPPKRSIGSISIMSKPLIGGSKSLGPSDDYPMSGYGPDDSDEGGQDDQSHLSDYPDSSQANRRRPYFKEGPPEISCKSDVRTFAVCGQYVCTIGHSTKVWDVLTGRCVMSLAHSEGTRITAVAFKPSVNVESEGNYLWLGTSLGELMEVDIAAQRIIDTRTSAHTKKEVVKIHRCGFELWSLDEGGKLQVWGPDINGQPNLRNSPTTFRINPKHSCSIVVDGYLWVGSGKNVDVYQPSTDPTRIFNVSSRQLTATKTAGDITCAATVNSQPDRVYFGHSDGKVSIYSQNPLQFIDVVSVSLYKINSMTGVGDYLWAGFKTGMVYVYDVRSKPWKAIKDWQCCESPIIGVQADLTSIWKNGRLQVVTMGTDNVIRVWDGMLEEDTLEAEMHKKDVEFCSFREIRALICTWNAGASKPQDLLSRDCDKVFLESVLNSVDSPDIIVFGFQELVDLEDKKITAKSFLKKTSKKKKAADQQEHMSHQYRLWQQQLTKSIETHMPRDEPYILLHAANLVGLFTCIFIKTSIKPSVRNVAASTVKRGLGGLHGNKGALVVRFFLDDSSLCFINCHLAAGQSHTMSRNNDIAAILESESLPVEPASSTRTDMFVGGGDGSMILDHEICILNGDLNYRIDHGRDSIINRVKNNDLGPLLERDQLLVERKKNPGFRLRVFNESPITFAPTYKYDVGTDTYDSSDKKRSPAWCDRLLYRGLGKIKQTEYRRWEVKASDHRPVSGIFLIRAKTVDHKRREMVWRECVRAYEEVRAKHIMNAKLDYLVSICGYGLEEAQQTLSRKEEVVDAVRSLEKHYGR